MRHQRKLDASAPAPADAPETGAVWVGIDVSQKTVDGAERPRGVAWQEANDETGIAQVVARRAALRPALRLMVMEATGGLERSLVAALALAGLPVAVITPRQGRACAKATGRLAKPDALDAALLAWPRRSSPPCARCPTPTPRRWPRWSSDGANWWACAPPN